MCSCILDGSSLNVLMVPAISGLDFRSPKETWFHLYWSTLRSLLQPFSGLLLQVVSRSVQLVAETLNFVPDTVTVIKESYKQLASFEIYTPGIMSKTDKAFRRSHITWKSVWQLSIFVYNADKIRVTCKQMIISKRFNFCFLFVKR